MYFKNLEINSWQQFEKIDIDFNSRLTVLTGANGSGKTTLLNILSKHSGWAMNSLATPKKDMKTKAINYITRWWKGANKSNETAIGQIVYNNNAQANITIPNQNSAQYQVLLQSQQTLKCFLYLLIVQYLSIRKLQVFQRKRKQNKLLLAKYSTQQDKDFKLILIILTIIVF
jgi:predicted ATP-binding protein involved in virulence